MLLLRHLARQPDKAERGLVLEVAEGVLLLLHCDLRVETVGHVAVQDVGLVEVVPVGRAPTGPCEAARIQEAEAS